MVPGVGAVAADVRIGILQTDRVRDELVDAHGDYPDMFAGVLARGARRVDAGLAVEFSTWDVTAGDYPPSLDAADAWLITGSRYSTYDPEPWIARLEGFVRELHAARVPLVGICFGHQLVAQALGGHSAAHPQGWAVGAHAVDVLQREPWMEPPRDQFVLLCSHRDQVQRLPDGARLLAGNAFCRIAAFALDEHIITFQGHPEFRTDYARSLFELRRPVLGDALADAALESLSTPADADLIGAWIIRFVASR